jgi:tetratricopeptide (TPR) repeat protein
MALASAALAVFLGCVAVRYFLSEVWLRRAMAASRAARWHEVVAAGRRATDYNPYNLLAQYNVGHAFNKLKMPRECIAACLRIRALAPLYNRANHNMAVAYVDMEDYDRAAQALEEIIPTDSGEEDYLFLGLVYSRAGEYDEAHRVLTDCLKHNPRSGDAFRNLAFLARKQHRPLEAANWIRRWVAVSPGDASAHLALGNAYLKEGQAMKPLALAELQLAEAMDPQGSVGALARKLLDQVGSRQPGAPAPGLPAGYLLPPRVPGTYGGPRAPVRAWRPRARR